MENFQQANARDEEIVRQGTDLVQINWKPPPLREIKINWDTALDNCQGRTGLGMIVRDSLGNFVAARGIPIASKLEPVLAEAQAALHATFFAEDLGFTWVNSLPSEIGGIVRKEASLAI